VQVPFELQPGTANVTVTIPGGGSTTVPNVPIQAVSPGIFTMLDPLNNQSLAVATRPDGSYVSSVNPARRGEVVRVYATGLGQTSPGTATNRGGAPGQRVAASLVVGVNNAGARLVSAELLPGVVGVYVVAIEIPVDTPASAASVIAIGVDVAPAPIFAQPGVTIPIQ
jgi:uncharacterized protein (TIGR03437 family)